MQLYLVILRSLVAVLCAVCFLLTYLNRLPCRWSMLNPGTLLRWSQSKAEIWSVKYKNKSRLHYMFFLCNILSEVLMCACLVIISWCSRRPVSVQNCVCSCTVKTTITVVPYIFGVILYFEKYTLIILESYRPTRHKNSWLTFLQESETWELLQMTSSSWTRFSWSWFVDANFLFNHLHAIFPGNEATKSIRLVKRIFWGELIRVVHCGRMCSALSGVQVWLILAGAPFHPLVSGPDVFGRSHHR